jgi:cbb3-type cytochrome oxidase subunit 3
MREWNAILIIFCCLVAIACSFYLFNYYKSGADDEAKYRQIAFKDDDTECVNDIDDDGDNDTNNSAYQAWFKELNDKN